MSITAKHEFDIRTDCWSGAADTIEELTNDEIDTLEAMIEEMFAGETPTDTDINDFIWFERDTIAEWLGYEDFDAIINRNKDAEKEME